jgi:hypothetical protein
MLAADVLRLVSGALQDLEPGMEKRWPWEGEDEPERVTLMHFLNSAIRAVCLQRPDVTAITEAIQLEVGMRQGIPTKRKHGATHDAAEFIGLVRNMGRDGETPGSAIISVQPDILLAWSDMGHKGQRIDNFAYDRFTNRLVYYVYPAVPDNISVFVEATYSIGPAEVKCAKGIIPLPDSYAQALKHHILSEILLGDNESSNAAKGTQHYQMFNSLLGVKAKIDTFMPKAKSTGAS